MTPALAPIKQSGTAGFLTWLQRAQPWAYEAVKKKLQTQRALSGFAIDLTIGAETATPSSPLIQGIKDVVSVAGQAYLTVQQQRVNNRILDIQLARAQQGLQPLDIDPSQYGVTGPSVNVGLTSDIKKMLIFGAVGFGALMIVLRMTGKRQAHHARY